MTMITATAIVSLDERTTDKAHLSAEIDSRPDGLNAGRTNFPKRTSSAALNDSQRPAFLLWHCGVLPPVITVIGGTHSFVGSENISHDENIMQFLEPGVTEYTHRLDKPASSAVAWSALNHGGATIKSTQTVDGKTVSVTLAVSANPVNGSGMWLVGKIRYRSTASAYRVTQDVGVEQVYFLAAARPK